MTVTESDEARVQDASFLRIGFSMFPSGVVALCALVDGVPIGLAASTFTPVSLDPPLVSVCVAHTSSTWPVLRDQPLLGVSVLSVGHRDVVRQLAAKGQDRFAGVDYEVEDGAVLLQGASMSAGCSVDRVLPVGDHDIVVLEVRFVRPHPDIAPIVFHASGLHALATS